MTINNLIGTINCIIFILLSGIHLYWASGGKLWLDKAIPLAFKDRYLTLSAHKSFVFITMLVCVSLLVMAGVTISHTTYIDMGDVSWIKKASIVLGLIFLIRAIGDFKHCGFFKKHGIDEFSKMDSKLYSPLCFYLSVSFFFLLG